MGDFTKREIQDQLNKICATKSFRRSERLQEFLRYIIDETLNGKAEGIKAWTIAVAVFNKPIDLNIQTDSIVRVYGGKLRRALKDYYENEGKDDPVIIRIPKGGYQPSIVHKDDMTIFGHDQQVKTQSQTQEHTKGMTPTIEVYQFEGLNTNDRFAYLPTGLTSEIIIALTKYSPLEVLGPFDESQVSDLPVRRDGSHNHDVTFKLMGRVQLLNETLRISASLCHTKTGKNFWGKTYKYGINEFSLDRIEEELVSQLTSEIADGLGVIFRKLYKDSYSEHIRLNKLTIAVLKYNHAWLTQNPADWSASLRAIEESLVINPQSPLLLALKSNVYYADGMQKLGIYENSAKEMESIATKAISLDADLQVAQYNMVVQHAYHRRLEECIHQAKKVVAMNPNNARVLAGCAVATASVESYEQALGYIERAKKLNPHYPGWYHFIDFLVAYSNGEYEKAWVEVQKVHVDGQYLHPLFRAAILGTLGNYKQAKPYLEELVELAPDFRENPYDYLYPLLVTEKHVDLFWNGLNKAWSHIYQTDLPDKSTTVKVEA